MARPMASSTLSISQLESMLQSRKNDLNTLSLHHAKLSKELKDVEGKMSALGGTPTKSSASTSTSAASAPKKMGRPPMARTASTAAASSTSGSASGTTAGGRARNAKSLIQTLEEVLGGSTAAMKVGDIVDAVLKSGYKTGSDNFRGIVNQTLIKERKRFTSAGRGLYKGKK